MAKRKPLALTIFRFADDHTPADVLAALRQGGYVPAAAESMADRLADGVRLEELTWKNLGTSKEELDWLAHRAFVRTARRYFQKLRNGQFLPYVEAEKMASWLFSCLKQGRFSWRQIGGGEKLVRELLRQIGIREARGNLRELKTPRSNYAARKLLAETRRVIQLQGLDHHEVGIGPKEFAAPIKKRRTP